MLSLVNLLIYAPLQSQAQSEKKPVQGEVDSTSAFYHKLYSAFLPKVMTAVQQIQLSTRDPDSIFTAHLRKLGVIYTAYGQNMHLQNYFPCSTCFRQRYVNYWQSHFATAHKSETWCQNGSPPRNLKGFTVKNLLKQKKKFF